MLSHLFWDKNTVYPRAESELYFYLKLFWQTVQNGAISILYRGNYFSITKCNKKIVAQFRLIIFFNIACLTNLAMSRVFILGSVINTNSTFSGFVGQYSPNRLTLSQKQSFPCEIILC